MASKHKKHMRFYQTNIYQTWVNNGKLEEILNFITDCSKKLYTQKEIAEKLGINQNTFSTMKGQYPEIKNAIDRGKFELKEELGKALYRKALGYETTEEDQYIENKDGKQIKKVHRIKKEVAPDYKSIVYLLTKTCGREYGERYEELKMRAEMQIKSYEQWEKSLVIKPKLEEDDEE